MSKLAQVELSLWVDRLSDASDLLPCGVYPQELIWQWHPLRPDEPHRLPASLRPKTAPVVV